jgi:hypothetical protein
VSKETVDRFAEGLPQRHQGGLRSFSVERQQDESGVSGTGIVLEGVVFSTGVVVVHWLTPPPHGSVNIFTSFDQFMGIHVGPHPTNGTRIHWSGGEVWEPGGYHKNPNPWQVEP